MKALTNHVVPSRSAQLVHFPMVLLSSPLLPFSPPLSLYLSRFFLLFEYTHSRTYTYTHTHTEIDTYTYSLIPNAYRSLLFPFISSMRSPANTEAETNSCTLIQFVRIKDTINNVFNRVCRDWNEQPTRCSMLFLMDAHCPPCICVIYNNKLFFKT